MGIACESFHILSVTSLMLACLSDGSLLFWRPASNCTVTQNDSSHDVIHRQEASPPDGLPEGEEPEGGSPDDKEKQDENPEPRRAGGDIEIDEHDPIRLRILLDGSVCEIFTSTGTVLTTRVNR